MNDSMGDSMGAGVTSYASALLAYVLSMDGNDLLLFLSVVLVLTRICIEVPKAVQAIRRCLRSKFNGSNRK